MTARPFLDQVGIDLAYVWSRRSTCARRRVGCVLFDAKGFQIGAGYNGPASGEPNCTLDNPCPGASCAAGQGLELCEAVHAEINALMRCERVRDVHTVYSTASPCVHCVKAIMNTPARRIVFAEEYPHPAARELWVRRCGGETSVMLNMAWRQLAPSVAEIAR